MIFINYDEAQGLVNHKCLFIARGLYRVRLAMLSRSTAGIIPASPIDMLFFYNVVAESLELSVGVTSYSPLSKCSPNTAFNFPRLGENNRRIKQTPRRKVLNKFLDLVHLRSVPGGQPFDVSFAYERMSVAFDDEPLEWVIEAGDKLNVPDPNNWWEPAQSQDADGGLIVKYGEDFIPEDSE